MLSEVRKCAKKCANWHIARCALLLPPYRGEEVRKVRSTLKIYFGIDKDQNICDHVTVTTHIGVRGDGSFLARRTIRPKSERDLFLCSSIF